MGLQIFGQFEIAPCFPLRRTGIEFGIGHIKSPYLIEGRARLPLKRAAQSRVRHDEVEHIGGTSVTQAGVIDPLHSPDGFGQERPHLVDS